MIELARILTALMAIAHIGHVMEVVGKQMQEPSSELPASYFIIQLALIGIAFTVVLYAVFGQ